MSIYITVLEHEKTEDHRLQIDTKKWDAHKEYLRKRWPELEVYEPCLQFEVSLWDYLLVLFPFFNQQRGLSKK